MEYLKGKIWSFLNFIQLKFFGRESLEKGNIRIECWNIMEILEAHESEIAIKNIPNKNHRKLFKIVFLYGCLKALVEKKSLDEKKEITEELFWSVMAAHRNPIQRPFGLTSEQHHLLYNYWKREGHKDNEGICEYKGLPEIVKAGKIAMDTCDVIENIVGIDQQLYSETILMPFESILEDKKFLKSERTKDSLLRHDMFMNSEIQTNEIKIKP